MKDTHRNPWIEPLAGDRWFSPLGLQFEVTGFKRRRLQLQQLRGSGFVSKSLKELSREEWLPAENRFGFTVTDRVLHVTLRHSSHNNVSSLGVDVSDTADGPFFKPWIESSYCPQRLACDLRQLADALSGLALPLESLEAVAAKLGVSCDPV